MQCVSWNENEPTCSAKRTITIEIKQMAKKNQMVCTTLAGNHLPPLGKSKKASPIPS